MVKQCCVYACSKGAVSGKQIWKIFPNDNTDNDAVINYENNTLRMSPKVKTDTFNIRIRHTETS